MTVTRPDAVPAPPVPAYGSGTLADLARSVFASVGVPGLDDPLAIGPLPAVCFLLVDGLGWELLRAARDRAPFLAELSRSTEARPLASGFPSTTGTSLTSLGTGLAPGRHGVVGYTLSVPGYDRLLNVLRFEPYGAGPKEDLRTVIVPESLQPNPTLFEMAGRAGVTGILAGPAEHAGSGLTRMAFRGAGHRPAHGLGDLAVVAAEACAQTAPCVVLAYHGDLDTAGHVRGSTADASMLQLAHVDRLAASIAERLPPSSALIVSGDHGMVDLLEEQKVDLADRPELGEGVRLLGGEARARHVYAKPGAAGDVLAAWRQAVGDRMWVASREEAIAARWFGASVDPEVRPRIGDVVAAAHSPIGVFQRSLDRRQAALVGHHGSMTPGEQLVPYLIYRV